MGDVKKKNKINFPMILGIVLMAAAVFIFAYNMWRQYRAGVESQNIVEQIENISLNSDVTTVSEPEPEKTTDMPEVSIDGETYVGILSIPALGLKLPVMKELNYSKLNVAPCVYKGSVYEDDLIIAAHNFSTHFGRIKNLGIGDKITFTDMEGTVFEYEISDTELIDGHDGYSMEEAGDWDMTLFTCNLSGVARVTVRCKRISDIQ